MAEVDEYLQSSNKYWRQAIESLQKGEYEKASEFAWGSVATRIKALALAKTGSQIKSHREIREYIKRISSQIGNEAMYRAYGDVEGLHSNFYESGMDPDDVKDVILRTEVLVSDLDRLMT